MARAKSPATPQEAFLKPLAQLAQRQPEIEGLVFWGGAGGWPSEPSEAMDSEEIAFYLEGLIPEGFSLEWRVVAEAGSSQPDHVQIFVWEEGEAPPDLSNWQILSSARYPA